MADLDRGRWGRSALRGQAATRVHGIATAARPVHCAATETDPHGQRSTSTYDARSWPTTLAYDALGRETQRLWLDGGRLTTTYDALGRVVARVDAAGYTTHTYDMGSRLTSVDLPLGKSLTYGYDAVGRRTRLVDQDGGWTTWTFDPVGRPVTVLNPFGETTTWAYDALGRPVSKLLADGVGETTVYDAAGRPTVRRQVDAEDVLLACYTATYDAAGNRLRVEELDGTFEYGYDAGNQLIAEQRTGSHAYGITYTYDAVGNRLAIDQSGAAARSGWLGRSDYAYNAADELLAVTPQAPPAGEVTLAPRLSPPLTGPAYALTLPLRTSFVYTLDTATLDLIGASGAWDEANAWHLALTARDDAGIVSTLATTTWAAAGVGRVELTPPEPVTLDADATPRLGVSVSRVGAPPPLVGLAGTASLSGALKPTTYSYDANGNTIGIDGPGGPVTLTWDAENRLIGVDAPDGSETYDYDSTTSVPGKVTGLRRSKTTAAGTTHFVWDQQNLLAALDGELERLVQYTGFPGGWGGLASARAGASRQSLSTLG